MTTPDSVVPTTGQAEWTAASIAEVRSPYYPLCDSGQLCPLLDDEELLYDFYVTAGLRQSIKRFCKTHRWSGRPQAPYTMTDDALKKLIRSMCNSADARRALTESDDRIALHNAIWTWFGNTDKSLFDVARSYSHQDKSGKYFMTPSELGRLFADVAGQDPLSHRHSLLYLALAFAMLETESRFLIIAEVVTRYPETACSLGLCREPVEQLHKTPESTPDPQTQVQLHEPPGSKPVNVAMAPSESTSGHTVDCWATHVDDLLVETQVLSDSSEHFRKHAEELAALEQLTAFATSGDAAFLLSSLESERRHILNQSTSILSSLAVLCKDPDGNGCELQRFVRQFQDKPAGTVPDLVITAAALRQEADALLSKVKTARTDIKGLKGDAANLSALLHLPDPSAASPDNRAVPCRIVAAASEQRRIVADLRRKISAEIINRKDALNAECERLSRQYDLSANATLGDCLPEYADLRSRIASAEDLEDIQVCHTLLAKLEDTCRAAQNSDPWELATQLQKGPAVLPVLLDLCRSLISEGSPEVAYLLLHIRQHSQPFEDIISVADRALSTLVEAACASASGDLPSFTVWQTLCAHPWLLSVGHGDIESSDLHERIVIALLGAALAGEAEQAAAVLVKIGAADLTHQGFPDSLHSILQAVIARRPIHIATPKELGESRRQENAIQEDIAYIGGKYRHLQCGEVPHFARFEAIQVFPALSELWDSVSSDLRAARYKTARDRVDKVNVHAWYAELVRKYDKLLDEHPHLSGRIRAFMQSFLTHVQEHVTYRQEIWGGDRLVLAAVELNETLKQWAGTQKARRDVSAVITKDLSQSSDSNDRPSLFWYAIGLCPSVIQRCPHFVIWLRAQQDPTPGPQLERLILDDLAINSPVAEAARVLEADSAWEQLSVLSRSINDASTADWIGKHQNDVADLAVQRKRILAVKDPRLIASFDACIQSGRLTAARQLLHHCGQRKAEELAQQKESLSSFVDDHLKKIDAIKDIAADANMPVTWMDTLCRLATKVDLDLRRLRRSEEAPQAVDATQTRLTKAVEALTFVVEQRTRVFDAVEHFLTPSPTTGTDTPIPFCTQEKALARYPDLHMSWNILACPDASDSDDTTRAWINFVKHFAKVCNLYYDEHDERKRFATVPSIKYPFTVYQTAFYKPRSEFLKRPLRIYLYRQRDVDIPALQRLEAALSGEGSAAWLHVVFAPQGSEKIRRYFRYDSGFKDFLIIDEAFLYRVSLADKHDVPVRQALHASVADLASSTPFVAQGYCHQSNNIYVGRKDVIQKLLNTPQAMIWGGRRIGKTSVLHALENALRYRDYRVAYVYVDLEDEGDPDLSIAQKILANLDLPSVNSIPAFERQITGLRNIGVRLAFLIDEVDEYIKKSRVVHGDGFPLATTLRQLVMDDSAKDTVLVYSGYHQLYYEARLDRSKRRVGHPFINTAQDIPIRNLTHDEVHELVTTGFEDMLDIGVSPEVPPLIFKRASSHPAFVQQFCRCLLERVSMRRSPGARVTISAEDVEAVYAESATREGGEQPFIFYVNETLGYNLSHLGRAIMLTVCHLLSHLNPTENEDCYFPIQKVNGDLIEWCEILGVARPEPEHFRQTIELLVMTNMLTQNPQLHDNYRVTYPTYVDILHRLDKLGRTALEHSLHEYDSKERGRGVLL